MKFIWPPVMKAMQDRQKKIAAGLEAGERGEKELELSQQRATQTMQEAKEEASHLVEGANVRASKIVETGKERGRKEGKNIVANAQTEAEKQFNDAKKVLLDEVANIAIAGVAKILEKDVDKKAHDKMLQELVDGIV